MKSTSRRRAITERSSTVPGTVLDRELETDLAHTTFQNVNLRCADICNARVKYAVEIYQLDNVVVDKEEMSHAGANEEFAHE